jgi:phospholipase C
MSRCRVVLWIAVLGLASGVGCQCGTSPSLSDAGAADGGSPADGGAVDAGAPSDSGTSDAGSPAPDSGTYDAGPGSDGGGPGPGQIQHIIFVVKENRSYDCYFGRFPGSNGATTGKESDGGTVILGDLPDIAVDGDHGWDSALLAIDNGKMDKFDLIPDILEYDGGTCSWGPCNYVAAQQAALPNYWSMAQNYVLGDNFFSSLHGPSFPNHLFVITAQSGAYPFDSGYLADGGPGPTLGSRDNPGDTAPKPYPPTADAGTFVGYQGFAPAGIVLDGGNAACDAQPNARGPALDGEGNEELIFPCYDVPTIGDLLTHAGITWRMYGATEGQSGYAYWSIFASIRHIRESPTWDQHLSYGDRIFDEIDTGTLPAVTWVTGYSNQNEHPPASTCVGENWTVDLLNQLGASPLWSSTVVFITWDDFGGFYDHVPPQQIDEFGLGARVPFLIVSPYALQGHVDSTQGEFSSVLRFIEDVHGLPHLTNRDTNTTNLFQDFDFGQAPRAWTPLTRRTCP